MSSVKVENLKVYSILSSKSNLSKFLARDVSLASIYNKTWLKSCNYKRNSTKLFLKAYDRQMILIITTFSNFFNLLEKSLEISNSSERKIFLEYLKIFKEYAMCKFKERRATADENEKLAKIILKNNEQTKVKQERLFMQLTKRINNFNEWCNLRKRKISIFDNAQQKLKQFLKNRFEDDMYDGNMRILLKSKIRKDTEEHLYAVEKVAQNEYQILLDENLAKQKILVEQKLKAEQTLKAIFLKFDNNVGSRVAEIESIEGDIKDNKQNFEKWKLLIAQQEANYVILMKEKEEEELLYRNRKLEELRINHAAKVIQVNWKRYKIKTRKAKNHENRTKQPKKNKPKRMR